MTENVQTLTFRILLTAEDNPILPEDVVVWRSVSWRADRDVDLNEAVGYELRSAGTALLAFLRNNHLVKDPGDI